MIAKCIRCREVDTIHKTKNKSICRHCRTQLPQDVMDLREVELKVFNHDKTIKITDVSKMDHISTSFVLYLHNKDMYGKSLCAYDKMLEIEELTKKKESSDVKEG